MQFLRHAGPLTPNREQMSIDRLSSSRSDFVTVRGLRYHVRHWSEEPRHGHASDAKHTSPKPMLFLLHGWLDVSATFHDLVLPLLDRWQVLAPDWRGFGLSEWPQDGYWFPDYLGDLDALLDHYAPDTAVDIIGHSLGAQVLSAYAGLRPDRVGRMALLDGLFLPEHEPETAPRRLTRWLDEIRQAPRDPRYDSFEQLAERVRRLHPRLSTERALFVARCWGYVDDGGRIGLRADPRHRRIFATLYRAAESKAIWRQVTARTLFIDAGLSELHGGITRQERGDRLACFADRQEVTIEDCGHMLHFEAPERTAALLRAFFSE